MANAPLAWCAPIGGARQPACVLECGLYVDSAVLLAVSVSLSLDGSDALETAPETALETV